MIDAECVGPWELPVLGVVSAPTVVSIRPDGYVAWVGDDNLTRRGLTDALTTWFGAPAAAATRKPREHARPRRAHA
jgi:3-(3-hydroxy-phenyl)propionate hydroxylase